MAFCTKCGNQTDDDARFCNSCGAPIAEADTQSQAEGASNGELPPIMPMKFHNHLVWWIMWVGMFLNFSQGVGHINGMYVLSSYGIDTDVFYNRFPDLVVTDRIYGVLLIGTAVFQFVTRFRLKRYKKNAPFLVVLSYALVGVVGGIFNILNNNALKLKTIIADGQLYSFKDNTTVIMTALVGSLVVAFLVYVYFSKRKHFYIY